MIPPQRWHALRPWPLLDAAATRRLEREAAGCDQAGAANASSLMQRAGLSVARLALAVAPHARRIWVACGPGNNGGDGLEAAAHLHRWGRQVAVTLAAARERLPTDAAGALARMEAAGLRVQATPPEAWDLGLDALLGLGATRPLQGVLADHAARLARHPALLAVDLPSGLSADTGMAQAGTPRARWTLALLGLKPGLFTADGRDHAGEIWCDDLGVAPGEASVWLPGQRSRCRGPMPRTRGGSATWP